MKANQLSIGHSAIIEEVLPLARIRLLELGAVPGHSITRVSEFGSVSIYLIGESRIILRESDAAFIIVN